MKFYTRVRITTSLKRKGFSKNTKTAEIIGCDWKQLKEHIEAKFEKRMSWENRKDWHLDHFIPLSVAETEDEVNRLNHYTNLRPLWKLDNLQKGSKIPKGFEISLFKAGLPLEECFSG